jgi:hypothetical protein
MAGNRDVRWCLFSDQATRLSHGMWSSIPDLRTFRASSQAPRFRWPEWMQANCLPWKSHNPRPQSSGSKFASMRSSVGSSARVCGYCRDRRRSRQPIPRDQRGQFTRNYGRHRLDLERCRTDGAFGHLGTCERRNCQRRQHRAQCEQLGDER